MKNLQCFINTILWLKTMFATVGHMFLVLIIIWQL